MPCWENKKYILEKSQNFDPYLKELGVGLVLRKMGATVIPSVRLETCNHYNYKLTTKTKYKSSVIEFVMGEKFDELTLDGRKVKSVIKRIDDDDNRLIHRQKGYRNTTIVRDFTADCLITTMICNQVVCVRAYGAIDCECEDCSDEEGEEEGGGGGEEEEEMDCECFCMQDPYFTASTKKA